MQRKEEGGRGYTHRGLTLLALGLHHTDAERKENGHSHGSRGHSAAIPSETQEGAELNVAPPHVYRAHEGGGENPEDHGLERPPPDEAESSQSRRAANAETDAEDERLLLFLSTCRSISGNAT